MAEDRVLNVQDVAGLLHVGTGTVYELVKRGEISSFRVGRKVRFLSGDVEDYIRRAIDEQSESAKPEDALIRSEDSRGFVIGGQDLILDVLSNYMRLRGIPTLRSYIGSYDSLVALYHGRIDVAACHLWDGDTTQYNSPYVRRLVPGIPVVIIHLACRKQGFFVAKGNPKNIGGWEDLLRPDVTIVNREKGAGSRILMDEHLRLMGVGGRRVRGYDNETQSHFAVAGAVAAGDADAAVGHERIARQVEDIDFVPLEDERYELAVLKGDLPSQAIQTLLKIVRSREFKREFENIGGYDVSDMGAFVAET